MKKRRLYIERQLSEMRKSDAARRWFPWLAVVGGSAVVAGIIARLIH
jgi:hypothetical protein